MPMLMTYLHEGVGDEDDMHAVEHRRNDGMPQTHLSLEILKKRKHSFKNGSVEMSLRV